MDKQVGKIINKLKKKQEKVLKVTAGRKRGSYGWEPKE